MKKNYREWVKENLEFRGLEITEEELDHVVHCLTSLIRWYFEDVPLGDFLRAVVRNDLMEAFGRADATNTKFMCIYPIFLYCQMPVGWREKAKED